MARHHRLGREATPPGALSLAITAVFAPDGTWLATTNWDHMARIWDIATGRCRATLTGHTGDVESVAIAPDGSWLATASSDQTIRVWDATTNGIAAIMRADSRLSNCTWSPSGRLLAATGDAGLYLFAFNS